MTISIRIPDKEIIVVGDVRCLGVEQAAVVVNHTGEAIDFVVHGPGVGVVEIRKADKRK